MDILIGQASITTGDDLGQQLIKDGGVTPEWLNTHDVKIPLYHDGEHVHAGTVAVDGAPLEK